MVKRNDNDNTGMGGFNPPNLKPARDKLIRFFKAAGYHHCEKWSHFFMSVMANQIHMVRDKPGLKKLLDEDKDLERTVSEMAAMAAMSSATGYEMRVGVMKEPGYGKDPGSAGELPDFLRDVLKKMAENIIARAKALNSSETLDQEDEGAFVALSAAQSNLQNLLANELSNVVGDILGWEAK